MRSFNLNILQAVSTLHAAGEITTQDLRDAIAEKRGLNMPCGHVKTELGHFASIFVATEKDDRTKARRSEDGKRIKFNFRGQDVKKTQEAQTPGKVLPQGTQGAPQLPPEVLAAIAEVLGKLPAQAPAQAQAQVEDDFSELNEVL